jgi:hypothetical protein
MFKEIKKEVEGRISILWNSQDKDIKIEIEDTKANSLIATVKLDAVAFCMATLGNLASMKCTIGVGELEKVGKKMLIDKLVFEVPENLFFSADSKDVAAKLAVKECPDGWEPQLYFNSQNSFFTKDGKAFAQCTIRKWVEE